MASELQQIAEREGKVQQLKIGLTFNIISTMVLEAVITVHFQKSDSAQVLRAQTAVQNMLGKFSESGYYAYRMNINQMTNYPWDLGEPRPK